MNCRINSGARTSQRGFTLLELMIVAALFSIVVGFIFALFAATVRTAAIQDTQIAMRDDARNTMERTMQLLRGAPEISISGVDLNFNPVDLTAAPAVQLTFLYPLDLDNDFLITGPTEYTGLLTLGLDLDDVNGDGLTDTQVIMLDDDGQVLEVLTSRVVEPNGNAGLGFAPLGGFNVEYTDDESSMTITLVLQDTGLAGADKAPLTMREERVVELKNVN